MQLVPEEMKTLSKKPRIPPEKMKEIQERASALHIALKYISFKRERYLFHFLLFAG
jgi:hypothetical protein